jgi:hypothetical protein
MRVVQQFAAIAAGALIVGASACADRGTGYSEDRNAGASSANAGNEDRVAMTMTGCFQDMSGPNNFVLTDVADAPGASPAEKRAYRIEQSGDFEQYVGKKVTVKGWVDADSQPHGMPAGQAKSGDADFNDLPELHVDTVSAQGEACGSGAK